MTGPTNADLEHRTRHHPPTAITIEQAHAEIRRATLDFLKAIRDATPASREQALALTNAEQAMMWANAAIARNQDAIRARANTIDA